MKFTIQQILDGENELILKYMERNEDVERALDFMNSYRQKLMGEKDGQKEIINRSDILYIESVYGRSFV